MQYITKQSFCEFYDIINHMDKQMKSKISDKFINFIEKNRDLNYRVDIDYSKSITNQNLLHETKVLLALIYRDYICDEEKKAQLIKQDNECLMQRGENLKKKYKIKFKEKQDNVIQNKENTLNVIEKQKWYTKIVKIIRNIFKIR